MPASHIIHNQQSLFPGPNKFAETHDPHPSTSHRSSLSNNTGLNSSLQPIEGYSSQKHVHHLFAWSIQGNIRRRQTGNALLHLHGPEQVNYFNPRAIGTVRPLPVQNKRHLLKLYNNTQNVPHHPSQRRSTKSTRRQSFSESQTREETAMFLNANNHSLREGKR